MKLEIKPGQTWIWKNKNSVLDQTIPASMNRMLTIIEKVKDSSPPYSTLWKVLNPNGKVLLLSQFDLELFYELKYDCAE